RRAPNTSFLHHLGGRENFIKELIYRLVCLHRSDVYPHLDILDMAIQFAFFRPFREICALQLEATYMRLRKRFRFDDEITRIGQSGCCGSDGWFFHESRYLIAIDLGNTES